MLPAQLPDPTALSFWGWTGPSGTTLLCDRGFRRVSWLKLPDQLRLGFVVRLMDDVQVQLEPGCETALAQVPLTGGRIVDLGRAMAQTARGLGGVDRDGRYRTIMRHWLTNLPWPCSMQLR
jgi:hypothetical protein